MKILTVSAIAVMLAATPVSAYANCTVTHYGSTANVSCYRNGWLRRALGIYTPREQAEALHQQAEELRDLDVLRQHGYR